MARFVNLDRLDSYAVFGTVLRRSRLSMQAAYDASFAAHARCSELLQSHLCHSHPRIEMLGFPIFVDDDADDDENGLDGNQLDTMWLDAIAEDFQSDQQAAPVILTADDTLQRFAKGVNNAPGLEPGFGPTYGGSTGHPVHLTTLLRAGTNTLRHVSEWDDTPRYSSKLGSPRRRLYQRLEE